MNLNEVFKKEWPSILVSSFFVVVVIAIAVILSKAELTDRESFLLTILLTLSSVLASFVIARIYARFTYSENLRDMGVQIARGIIVLERQTEVLLSWVSDKRSTMAANTSPEVVDAALEHIQETLSSFLDMNDAALSGIAGVIGDALAQYEAVMDHISEIRNQASEETQKVEAELAVARSHEEIRRLTKLIDNISVEANKRISALARSSSLPISEKPARSHFFAKCPYCGHESVEEMIDRQGETKVLRCESCEQPYNAHVTASPNLLTRTRGGRVTSPTASKAERISGQIEKFLKPRKRFVQPASAEKICDLAVRAAQNVADDGQPLTPYSVQQAAIALNNATDESEVSNVDIRRFFTHLLYCRFFKLNGQMLSDFKSEFNNDIENNGLLLAFLLSVTHAIKSEISIGEDEIPVFVKCVLGRDDFGLKEVGEALFGTSVEATEDQEETETDDTNKTDRS